MNTRQLRPAMATPQRQIQIAQQRMAQAQIPRGGAYGALAGQAPVQAQAQIPEGADYGALAGCGPDGGCASGYIPSPFAGMAQGGNRSSYLQPNALMGIFVQPASTAATTLEISCGNTFFSGCGARNFTPAGSILLTSIVSGFDTRDALCAGGAIDVAFFTTTECYCPFDFGCFSNLAPLLVTFDPIDTASFLQPLNMIIVGDRLEFDGCFPYPPGLIPPTTPPPTYPVPAMANPWHR